MIHIILYFAMKIIDLLWDNHSMWYDLVFWINTELPLAQFYTLLSYLHYNIVFAATNLCFSFGWKEESGSFIQISSLLHSIYFFFPVILNGSLKSNSVFCNSQWKLHNRISYECSIEVVTLYNCWGKMESTCVIMVFIIIKKLTK